MTNIRHTNLYINIDNISVVLDIVSQRNVWYPSEADKTCKVQVHLTKVTDNIRAMGDIKYRVATYLRLALHGRAQ